ncbi:MAG: response regulator, partial [Dehalococcoidia bacterium]|nr:response regulator [Dehalococcoidia bacterium]
DRLSAPDERDRRIRELEERLSRLGEASLRISESLDFDTVLQEVVDSARALTASRYGAITIRRETGRLSDLIVSGLSSEERQGLLDMPQGPAFFEYLSGLGEPLRVSDVDSHMSALNMPSFLPPVRATSLLVAPIRHQGVGVGTIYLAHDREDRHYTREDEETLVMFASQAAMVIANARRHRQEQQTRADLETLIDTSPVGVAVLDATTGVPKSLNREARRIVDSLRDPDQTPEDLLEALTFRRADGREVSLGEFPMAELLSTGETVRAEEIVLGVPEGRSVTVLLNATPIRSDEGRIESVVVTLQDMADIEKLERLRAEFLAMVSHELRGPLTSIKGSAATVLDSPSEVDPAVVRQFFRIIGDQADHMHDLVSDLLDVARIETGELAISPEPAEVAVLVDRARSAFLGSGRENGLSINIAPDLPLVTADRRRIVQVLGNLLSNAARHSPESSVIRVSAVRDGVHVAVSVADEGRGIPADSLPDLFRKFSRTQAEEQEGDTGLGLAICKGIVEAHGGRIWAESDGPGLGARFTFTLPSVEEAGSAAPGGLPAIPLPSSARRGQRDAEEPVRVLAVDDDPTDLRYVRDALTQAGYAPVVTGDPAEALNLVEAERPDLALLDLMLPGTNGIELMRDILKRADLPVIFLSAYGGDELFAQALEMGAVDYVAKPFSPTELAARIKAALRRRVAAEPVQPYVLGDLAIDYAERRVTVAGHRVHLTATEYGILAELSSSGGRVVTHQHLLERVWGEKGDGDVRPMRTMVSKLRRKLGEDADNPRYIFTEPRVGFRMPRGRASDGEPPATP